MTEYPIVDNVAPAPRRRRGRWVLPVIVALAVLLIGGGAVVTWMALKDRTTPAATVAVTSAPATTAPAFLSVLGFFVLIDDDEHWKVGQSCQGDGGYSDIRPGAQVVVTSNGETLGIAHIFGGIGYRSDGHVACRFGFAVVGVPAGRSFYAVEISHRGQVQFAERDLTEEISLSLGS